MGEQSRDEIKNVDSLDKFLLWRRGRVNDRWDISEPS